MLSPIRIVESSEIRRVVKFMKQFEQASNHVIVNIDHATKTYENMVDSGVAVVMVIEDDGELAGSLGFIVSQDLHSGEKIMVETFWFTDPLKRGCGLLLFDAFENYAKEYGINKLAMIHMVDSYPERLEKLYERKGYRLIEKHYVKGGSG